MELKNKELKAMYEAAVAFWPLKKALDKSWDDLAQSYTGEMLKTEREKIDAAYLDAKREKENTIRDTPTALIADLTKKRADKLAQGEREALDASKITLDYELLKLPVTLTGAEIEQLYDRNWTNPLFVRALREYVQGKNVILEHTVLKDPYIKAIDTANNVLGRVSSWASNEGGTLTMRDNPHMMVELDSQLTAAIDAAK